MKVKAGDYLLTKEKQLFRVVDVHIDVLGTYYDIKSCRHEGLGDYPYNYIRGIPRNRLRHLGEIIPEENITKILKILYG